MRIFQPFLQPRSSAPGGALLHPAFTVALVTLVVNDHLLKVHWPGVLSGKLSDFAVVPLLSLFLHGLLELACSHLGRPLRGARVNRWLLGCIALSCLMFALPEVWPPAERAYRHGAAALRYPFRALWALLRALPPPRFVPVRATADLTDLLALPTAWIAWRVGRSPEPGNAPRPDQASAVSHST